MGRRRLDVGKEHDTITVSTLAAVEKDSLLPELFGNNATDGAAGVVFEAYGTRWTVL